MPKNGRSGPDRCETTPERVPQLENAPQLSYIGPVAPIIGAIVGSVITAVVAYFFLAKRQSITFWVGDSEDITLPLRRQHRDISFTVTAIISPI
jgi:hypothetical protein